MLMNISCAIIQLLLRPKIPEKVTEEKKQENNNNFLANGTYVKRFKTIAENNIGNGFPVTLIVPN